MLRNDNAKSTLEKNSGNTRVERWIRWCKNNKVISIFIFGSLLIIGLATVTNSIKSIQDFIYGHVNIAKPLLTRVEAESFLQANRGDIERCLNLMNHSYYYIDFVFTQGPGSTIDVDILVGEEASPGLEFLDPSLRKREVESLGGHEALWHRSRHGDRKLSVFAPSVNGCILNL